MTALRRTSANGFDIKDAVTIEQLEAAANEERLGEILLPVDKALGVYGSVTVTEAQAKRFLNGGELFLERLKIKGEGIFRVYSPKGDFLGLGETEDEYLKVRRVFHN